MFAVPENGKVGVIGSGKVGHLFPHVLRSLDPCLNAAHRTSQPMTSYTKVTKPTGAKGDEFGGEDA